MHIIQSNDLLWAELYLPFDLSICSICGKIKQPIHEINQVSILHQLRFQMLELLIKETIHFFII